RKSESREAANRKPGGLLDRLFGGCVAQLARNIAPLHRIMNAKTLTGRTRKAEPMGLSRAKKRDCFHHVNTAVQLQHADPSALLGTLPLTVRCNRLLA